jgi:hypothetical protein
MDLPVSLLSGSRWLPSSSLTALPHPVVHPFPHRLPTTHRRLLCLQEATVTEPILVGLFSPYLCRHPCGSSSISSTLAFALPHTASRAHPRGCCVQLVIGRRCAPRDSGRNWRQLRNGTLGIDGDRIARGSDGLGSASFSPPRRWPRLSRTRGRQKRTVLTSHEHLRIFIFLHLSIFIIFMWRIVSVGDTKIYYEVIL